MSNIPGQSRFGGVGGVVFFIVAICLGVYFTFASVQGDYGIFRRVEVKAQLRELEAERDALAARIALISNKTLRLSDDYLDLDLLDEQAREILGYVRADEVVLQ
ncbi:MAG TPA: septum formation initiator family protein [Aliiroseovarius sp.]|nr:septum formation initiator family protein [Aliiroseovarius sp.]